MKKNFNKKGVYIIVNIINKKVYVGSTTDSFKNRWKNHRKLLKKGIHPNNYLQNSWNKYTENMFVFSIIECIENTSIYILDREKYYIEFYKATDKKYGYNIVKDPVEKIVEQETKDKISQTVKKLWKEGVYSNRYLKGTPAWNRGIKCNNISSTRRQNSPRIAVYYKEHLMCIFRSMKDLEEWTKTNILPNLTYYVDKSKRPNKGIKTSYLRGSNIERSIRNNKPLRGLIFKKLQPLHQVIDVVQWMNCWEPEMAISSQA